MYERLIKLKGRRDKEEGKKKERRRKEEGKMGRKKGSGSYVLTPRVEGMKDCPPNPGFTLMRRMMSTLSITYLQ